MINKREILETASSLGLLPSVVEKDYILGWLLAGIYAHPTLTEAWVFKGGTCLKNSRAPGLNRPHSDQWVKNFAEIRPPDYSLMACFRRAGG